MPWKESAGSNLRRIIIRAIIVILITGSVFRRIADSDQNSTINTKNFDTPFPKKSQKKRHPDKMSMFYRISRKNEYRYFRKKIR